MDVDGNENGRIELFSGGPGGTLLVAPISIPMTGDGGILTIDINVDGVDFMRVVLTGSGAIDDIVLGSGENVCGNNQLDPGEQCDGSADAACFNTICSSQCTCVPPICNDPSKVILYDPPRLDIFQGVGFVGTSISPEKIAGPLTLRLFNNAQTLYQVDLQPGDCVVKPNGKSCKFLDKPAKTGLGLRNNLKLLVVKQRNNGYRIKWQAFGDLNAAIHPHMGVELVVGGELFSVRGNWDQTKKGWKTKFPGISACR